MKNHLNLTIVAAMLAALATGCAKEGSGRSRLEAFPDRYAGSSRRDGGGGEPAPVPMDTAVFVAAVDFPEGYDWRRDTSYGSVTGRLVLYRDGGQVLSVPAGPGCRASLDHDLHHLVEGHLYTEYCTASETVIGRDGEDLFSYPGRELLCGLLVEGSDVYTLGQSRSGRGFSLRLNGEELFSRSEGTISSHLQDDSHYPSGALYRDSGHLYFSYFMDDGQGSRRWYIVEDGVETLADVPPGPMYDIRVRDGEMSAAAVGASTYKDWYYYDGKWDAWLTTIVNGTVAIYAPYSPSRVYLDPFFLPSFRNACLVGRHFYLGINPPGSGRPWLWKDGNKVYELEINGFITAVGYAAYPQSSQDRVLEPS